VCCSVLQCVAVCCSVLQCVAVCCSVLQSVAVCCSLLQCVAVCCSVLQCDAVWCMTRSQIRGVSKYVFYVVCPDMCLMCPPVLSCTCDMTHFFVKCVLFVYVA